MAKIKITALASGFGSTVEHVLDYEKREQPEWTIIGVVSENPKARVLEVAKRFGIMSTLLPWRNYSNREAFDGAVLKAVEKQNPDVIFLLGYLKKISPALIKLYPKRIFNTHPSLLPKYGGKGMFGRAVHESVIRSKGRESGVTIHEVSENYDEGRILLQKKISVDSGWSVDDLEEKIKTLEKNTVVEFLNRLERGADDRAKMR